MNKVELKKFIVSVSVVANSSANKIVSDETDLFGFRSIKAKVNLPRENGKANNALVNLLAEYFAVKPRQIKIISGKLLPKKIIEVITF